MQTRFILVSTLMIMTLLVLPFGMNVSAQDAKVEQKAEEAVPAAEAVPAEAVPAEAAPVAAPEPAQEMMVEESREVNYYSALANVHLNFQKYDEAKVAFAKALKLVKSEQRKYEIYSRLADLYFQLGEKDKSQKFLEKALEGTKDKYRIIEFKRRLAEMYKEQQNWEKAEEAYRYLAENSNEPWQKMQLKRSILDIYEKTGKLDSEIKKLEEELVKDPKNIDVLWDLHVIFREIKPDVGKSITILETLIEVSPENKKRELYEFLTQAYDSKMIDQKIETAKKMLQYCPKSDQVMCYDRIYNLYTSKSDWENAFAIAKKIYELDPENGYNVRRVLETLVNQKKIDDAYKLFQEQSDKVKGDYEKVELLFFMANTLGNNNQADKALELLKKIKDIAKEEYQKKRAEEEIKRISSMVK